MKYVEDRSSVKEVKARYGKAVGLLIGRFMRLFKNYREFTNKSSLKRCAGRYEVAQWLIETGLVVEENGRLKWSHKAEKLYVLLRELGLDELT